MHELSGELRRAARALRFQCWKNVAIVAGFLHALAERARQEIANRRDGKPCKGEMCQPRAQPWVTNHARPSALQGRHRFVARLYRALSGLVDCAGTPHPGLRPGLSHRGLSGLNAATVSSKLPTSERRLNAAWRDYSTIGTTIPQLFLATTFTHSAGFLHSTIGRPELKGCDC